MAQPGELKVVWTPQRNFPVSEGATRKSERSSAPRTGVIGEGEWLQIETGEI